MLYSRAGLAVAKGALAPRGVLAVGSGYRADAFLGHLRAAGFRPSVVPIHDRGWVRQGPMWEVRDVPDPPRLRLNRTLAGRIGLGRRT
jgi:hypothetical protein